MTFAIGGPARVRRVVKAKRLVKWVHACDSAASPARITRTLAAAITRCPDCGQRRRP